MTLERKLAPGDSQRVPALAESLRDAPEGLAEMLGDLAFRRFALPLRPRADKPNVDRVRRLVNLSPATQAAMPSHGCFYFLASLVQELAELIRLL